MSGRQCQAAAHIAVIDDSRTSSDTKLQAKVLASRSQICWSKSLSGAAAPIRTTINLSLGTMYAIWWNKYAL